jgi:molybdopterin converting factor small subunit
MKIESLYFGDLREVTGLPQETLSLKEDSKLIDLMGKLFETYGNDIRLQLDFGNSHIVLINGQHHEILGRKEKILKEGDKLAGYHGWIREMPHHPM